MKKTLIIAAATTIVTGILATGAVASAQTASTSSTDKTTTHHKHHIGSRLDQAVNDGIISSTQKTAFQTELKTLHTERKATLSKTSTKEEHQAERAKLKSELQTWAQTNDFPLAKLMPKLAQ